MATVAAKRVKVTTKLLHCCKNRRQYTQYKKPPLAPIAINFLRGQLQKAIYNLSRHRQKEALDYLTEAAETTGEDEPPKSIAVLVSGPLREHNATIVFNQASTWWAFR